jgi:hypothetical protein
MVNFIDINGMQMLMIDLIEFKDYYITNKKKTEENIKEDIKKRLSIIIESSSINVKYCIDYYDKLPGNLFPAKNGGGLFTKTKIQIRPIIIDLIAKLNLIILQQKLINQNINEMNPIFKNKNETNIKLKTYKLLDLCKTYITELQNLNIKIYEKKKYEKSDGYYSNNLNLLEFTINNINESLTKSVQPSRATRTPSRATQAAPRAQSIATQAATQVAPRAQSRATQEASRVVKAPSSSSSFSKYDSGVLKELEEIEEQLRKEEEEEMRKINQTTPRGGRIRRVKKENKKINEKVVKKKITTNKIKRKYLVKK